MKFATRGFLFCFSFLITMFFMSSWSYSQCTGELGPPCDNFFSNAPHPLVNGISGAESCNEPIYYNGPKDVWLIIPSTKDQGKASNFSKLAPGNGYGMKGDPGFGNSGLANQFSSRGGTGGGGHGTSGFGNNGFATVPSLTKSPGFGQDGVSCSNLHSNSFIGMPLSYSGTGSNGNIETGATVAGGSYHLFREDLRIPGRGMDWVFARIYKQEKAYDSIFGAFDTRFGNGWNFTYNDRLEYDGADSVILHEGGRHRFTLWQRDPSGDPDDFNFGKPGGYFAQLFRKTDGSWEWIFINGTVYFFDSSGFLSRIEDRAGNSFQFFYQDPNFSDALSSVKDTYNRVITYSYFPPGSGQGKEGKLQYVVDFEGRVLSFDYDLNGNLLAATSPAVLQDFDGSNLFPNGKTESYTYTNQLPDTLEWRMETIIRPNENDPSYGVEAEGTPVLVINYLDDPQDTFDGLVESMVKGPALDAEGNPVSNVQSYSYEEIQDPNSLDGYDPALEDDPSSVTTIIDYNGFARKLYLADLTASLTREEIFDLPTSNPAWESGSKIIFRYKYDQQSNLLIQETLPSGETKNSTYSTSVGPSASNLAQLEILPAAVTDPIKSGNPPVPNGQGFVDQSYSYEPIFNQIRTMTDPRELDPSYVPPISGLPIQGRYTTEFVYDYQEDETLISFLADKYKRNVTSQEIDEIKKNTDVNGNGITSFAMGNRIKIRYPTANLTPGSNLALVEGDTTQEVEELMWYLPDGQLLLQVDPEGNVDVYNYHPENDPDGDGTTIQGVTSTLPFGYLFEVVRDYNFGSPPSVWPERRESAAPIEATSSYYYDPVGNLTRFINPEGNEFRYKINELNETYEVINGFGSGIDQRIVYRYDANGNLIKKEIENAGSSAGDWVEIIQEFDLQDNQTKLIREVLSGVFIETAFLFDGDENLREVVFPEGNRFGYEFNTRNLLTKEIRGKGTLEESWIEYAYDDNANLIEKLKHTDPLNPGLDQLLPTTYIYDGFNRLHAIVNPIGTRTEKEYDPKGNVIRTAVFGYPNGPAPTDNLGANNVRLTENFVRHDELSRPYEIDLQLFDDIADGEDHAVETQGGIGEQALTKKFEFDRYSRLAFSIESDGETVEFDYDGLDRMIEFRDDLSNSIVYIYDKNSNLVETTQTERATIVGVSDEIFTSTVIYDALDRRAQLADNLGNTYRFYYDGQNNLIKTSDPNGPLPEERPRRQPPLGTYLGNLDGNVKKYFYDGLNRLTQKEILLTSDGLGDGTPNPGHVIDTITVQINWDDNSRILEQIDGNGNIARHEYDALNRVVATRYAYGSPEETTEQYSWDAANRQIGYVNQKGQVCSKVYDLASRPVNKTFSNLGAGYFGTTVQTFEFDGIGRLTKATDNNDGIPSEVARKYDSFSRFFSEDQTFGTSYEIENFFEDINKRITLSYPNGRQLDRTFDELDRVKTIDGNINYEFIGPNRVLERTFPNDTKLTFLGAATGPGYDGVKRILNKRHVQIDGGGAEIGTLAHFEYTHDRIGNRKTVRRHHEPSGSKVAGEWYEYDSAYRLTLWEEGLIATDPSPSPFVLAGGGAWAVTTGSGPSYSFDVSVLQTGGFPTDSYSMTIALPDYMDSQGWNFDDSGNWTFMRRTDLAFSLEDPGQIGPHNEYNEWIQGSQVYDANGNLVFDGVFDYEYDALNRLRRIRSGGQLVAEYHYDALNRRIYKKTTATSASGASEIRFLYDRWEAIEERAVGTEEVTRQFVYGERLDEILSMDVFTPLETLTYYFHDDSIGSVVALTDAGGNVVERYKYSPYGQPYILDSSSNVLVDGQGNFLTESQFGNPLLFTAARYDAEASQRTASTYADKTGLYYLRNRYLDSDRGRFLTRDPKGIWHDTKNLGNGYTYGENNPINVKDPSGLQGTDDLPLSFYHMNPGYDPQGASEAVESALTDYVDSVLDAVQDAAIDGGIDTSHTDTSFTVEVDIVNAAKEVFAQLDREIDQLMTQDRGPSESDFDHGPTYGVDHNFSVDGVYGALTGGGGLGGLFLHPVNHYSIGYEISYDFVLGKNASGSFGAEVGINIEAGDYGIPTGNVGGGGSFFIQASF